jgi:hypothetical protein
MLASKSGFAAKFVLLLGAAGAAAVVCIAVSPSRVFAASRLAGMRKEFCWDEKKPPGGGLLLWPYRWPCVEI